MHPIGYPAVLHDRNTLFCRKGLSFINPVGCQLVQELAGVKGPGCCHVWEADVGYTQPYWNNVKRFQGWKGSQAAPGPWKSPGYHWLVAALCVHLTMHIQHFSESC